MPASRRMALRTMVRDAPLRGAPHHQGCAEYRCNHPSVDTQINRFLLKPNGLTTNRSEMNVGHISISFAVLTVACTSARPGQRLKYESRNTTTETFKGYTESRRPVVLVYAEWFDRITDAIENERKLKKWTRAKKEAFIRGDFASLQALARRKTPFSKRPPVSS